ncbi:MAG: low specificity L-threonine aldolase [Peptostreptococcaceae bacterium]|nr:low specificity L-threonine aldolase [Peptostreptococcaceae bacterium]
MLYSFRNDYSEGAHPSILEALTKTNMNQEDGYGEDSHCVIATGIIREKTGNSNADIHFVSGGTQANMIVISSMLKPYESVISAETGHINGHETGAVESTGHKINTVTSTDGKLTTEGIKRVLEEHYFEHMVKPAMVYISNSTEVGTFYTKRELEDISDFCKREGLYLFADGARLGSALCAEGNDLTLEEFSALVDVFYIGGTKNGALIGEAIVINNEALKPCFRYAMKQRGALLAKGRILGVQFEELLRDDLYFELARHANSMAAKLTDGIKNLGYGFMAESTTNQIFPILSNTVIKKMMESYGFYEWCGIDESHTAIRLVTSWATGEDAVKSFLSDLKRLSQ